MKYTKELYKKKCSALPQSWRVLHEKSNYSTTQRFKETVLEYLNSNYKDYYSGNSGPDAYYGVIRGSSQCASGNSSWRAEGTVLLTVDEFINIVEQKDRLYEIY